MSYQHERDQFIARMAQEELPLDVTERLLRAATTLQRYAELACSSEQADRDRVPCPRVKAERQYATKPIAVATRAFERYPCVCDYDHERGQHQDVPRITVLGDRLERRIAALLAEVNKPLRVATATGEVLGPPQWSMDTQGDPRGYVLRVIPPSYAERNQGRDRWNRDSIGVPARDSRLRF